MLRRLYCTWHDIQGNCSNGEGCWCQESHCSKLRATHPVREFVSPLDLGREDLYFQLFKCVWH